MLMAAVAACTVGWGTQAGLGASRVLGNGGGGSRNQMGDGHVSELWCSPLGPSPRPRLPPLKEKVSALTEPGDKG